MKRFLMLMLLMVILSGCVRSPSSGKGRCNQGLCVKIEADEPVRWGELVVVRITVTTDRDVSRLGVSLYHDRDITVKEIELGEDGGRVVWEGERGVDWMVNARAEQPLTFICGLHLPLEERSWDLKASAITPQGVRSVDSVTIYITREGGEVYYSGTPVPITPGPLPTMPPELRVTPLPTVIPFPVRSPLPTPTQMMCQQSPLPTLTRRASP